MKRLWFLPALLVLILASGWFFRGQLRETWSEWNKPTLPPAQPFREPIIVPVTPPPTVPTTPSTTPPTKVPTAPTKPPIVKKPTTVDVFAFSGTLPQSVNLAVPFLSQAPKGDWSMPYQEACEEASMIMVNAFEAGRTSKFAPSEGDKAIIALTTYVSSTMRLPQDVTVREMQRIVAAYFPGRLTVLRENPNVRDIKTALANGYPVILPADGKILNNPNFQNGGPNYHMLVIKGYTADNRWITNDPGTRNGADYLYAQDVLMSANHDWNGGNVAAGNRVIMVMLP